LSGKARNIAFSLIETARETTPVLYQHLFWVMRTTPGCPELPRLDGEAVTSKWPREMPDLLLIAVAETGLLKSGPVFVLYYSLITHI